MQIHHTKMRQAMQMGCYLSESNGRIRIFWPQRSVELFAVTPDEALQEMQAVQNILHTYPDYRVITNSGCAVIVADQTKHVQMADMPQFASSAWAILEAGEDEWVPENGDHTETKSDPTHINGISINGGVAYKEGVPASDCPYLEDSDDFARWNDEWDTAADAAEVADLPNTVGSVVTNRYRAHYTELGHPTHCGDDLAVLLNNICQNKAGTNLEIFEAICTANDVNLGRYNRTKKGWQGRLRMTGRNLLAKKIIAQGGVLKMPLGMGDEKRLSQEWLINAEQKFKPKDQ